MMLLPEFRQVRYGKSPLRLVICQVRFPSLLRISDAAHVADFQGAIAREYPHLRREKQMALQLSAAGLSPTADELLYRFMDSTGAWSVVLGEGSLTLEARAYSGVEELLRRFELVTGAAREALGIEERQRLGLRYVNEFRDEQASTLADWREYFRAEFLGYAADLFQEPVTYAMHQLRVSRADGVFSVRHGLTRGTVVPSFPLGAEVPANPPQGPFYLLDLDYSDARPLPLDVKASREQLVAYNAFIYRFFRWTLTEHHHAALEPLDE